MRELDWEGWLEKAERLLSAEDREHLGHTKSCHHRREVAEKLTSIAIHLHNLAASSRRIKKLEEQGSPALQGLPECCQRAELDDYESSLMSSKVGEKAALEELSKLNVCLEDQEAP